MLFLSCPVILLHVHSPILSSMILSYPCTFLVLSCHLLTRSFSNPVIPSSLYYCCPILSSYDRLILRAFRHINSAFFNPVILSRSSSPIRSFSYTFILLSCHPLTCSLSYPAILSRVHSSNQSSSYTLILVICHPLTLLFSYSVILLHVHSSILSSYYMFIILSCHPLTRSVS